MNQKNFRVLAINPGSTSTKISIFDNDTECFSQTLRHDETLIGSFENIPAQYSFRMQAIEDFLRDKGVPLDSLHAVVGRGGLLKPIEGGTYGVNEAMLQDLRESRIREHASNLGGILAAEIGQQLGIPAFIIDPVVVDELEDIARLSGCPELPRISIFHALNHKAVARRAAAEMNGAYADFNFIVAHMGGGISVAAHRRGRVVDVNNALDGEGPFSPERSGTLPAGDLVRLCFSGKYSQAEISKMIKGKGGVTAYLGVNDMRKVEERILRGDEQARLVYTAMAYQVSKEIASLSAVLEGRVDAILLTGGVAYSREFTGWIEKRVKHIAPVRVYPGEGEMPALAEGALRVLRGAEQARVYA